MNKIVINREYGGFELSAVGLELFYKLEHPDIQLYFYNVKCKNDSYEIEYNKVNAVDASYNYIALTKDCGDKFISSQHNKLPYDDDCVISSRNINRLNSNLIKVVDTLGEKANGFSVDLEVFEFEGNEYRICEYDGYEWVETPESIDWNTIKDN